MQFIFHREDVPGPLLERDPLRFDSCKRPPPVSDHKSQPRSQGSLLPALRSERGENPGNEVAPVFGFWAVATSSLADKAISLLIFTPTVYVR